MLAIDVHQVATRQLRPVRFYESADRAPAVALDQLEAPRKEPLHQVHRSHGVAIELAVKHEHVGRAIREQPDGGAVPCIQPHLTDGTYLGVGSNA
eukprot:6984897-Prymnesium_polylepis.1